MFLKVLTLSQRRSLTDQWSWRKREDLEADAIESDEVLLDEAIADLDELIRRNLESSAYPILPVVADPISIASQYQEQVQGTLSVTELHKESLVEELVRNEGKTLLDDAKAVGPWRGTTRDWELAIGVRHQTSHPLPWERGRVAGAGAPGDQPKP